MRAFSRIAAVVAAAGSVVCVLWVGHRNRSAALLVLFILWVLSPFVVGAWADRESAGTPAGGRGILHGLTLVIAIGSLAIYGWVAMGPPRPKPAAFFLIVPVVSLLLLALAVVARRGKTLT